MTYSEMMSHLLRSLETINNRLGSIEQRITAVETKLASLPVCADPGQCGKLRDDLEEMREETQATTQALRDDVDEHRLLVAKLNGGWKMLTILVAVCSTLGSVVGWAISHFSK